jgi:hypothetical protein
MARSISAATHSPRPSAKSLRSGPFRRSTARFIDPPGAANVLMIHLTVVNSTP